MCLTVFNAQLLTVLLQIIKPVGNGLISHVWLCYLPAVHGPALVNDNVRDVPYFPAYISS